mgnify:CR=1 FL=1
MKVRKIEEFYFAYSKNCVIGVGLSAKEAIKNCIENFMISKYARKR